jgi:hypothetical protein
MIEVVKFVVALVTNMNARVNIIITNVFFAISRLDYVVILIIFVIECTKDVIATQFLWAQVYFF